MNNVWRNSLCFRRMTLRYRIFSKCAICLSTRRNRGSLAPSPARSSHLSSSCRSKCRLLICLMWTLVTSSRMVRFHLSDAAQAAFASLLWSAWLAWTNAVERIYRVACSVMNWLNCLFYQSCLQKWRRSPSNLSKWRSQRALVKNSVIGSRRNRLMPGKMMGSMGKLAQVVK